MGRMENLNQLSCAMRQLCYQELPAAYFPWVLIPFISLSCSLFLLHPFAPPPFLSDSRARGFVPLLRCSQSIILSAVRREDVRLIFTLHDVFLSVSGKPNKYRLFFFSSFSPTQSLSGEIVKPCVTVTEISANMSKHSLL